MLPIFQTFENLILYIIPDLSDIVSEGNCPVSVRVEVKTNLPSNDGIQVRNLSQPLVRIGEWIGEVYLIVEKSVVDEVVSLKNNKCQDWVKTQRSGIGDEILDLVSMHYPCPPTLNRAQASNSGLILISRIHKFGRLIVLMIGREIFFILTHLGAFARVVDLSK